MHTHTNNVLQKQRSSGYLRLCLFVIVSVSLRNLKTHYENINLQKDQKGRHELLIPRYHELVPKQAEKKVSSEYCVCAVLWFQYGPPGASLLPEGQLCCIIIMTSTLLFVLFRVFHSSLTQKNAH